PAVVAGRVVGVAGRAAVGRGVDEQRLAARVAVVAVHPRVGLLERRPRRLEVPGAVDLGDAGVVAVGPGGDVAHRGGPGPPVALQPVDGSAVDGAVGGADADLDAVAAVGAAPGVAPDEVHDRVLDVPQVHVRGAPGRGPVAAPGPGRGAEEQRHPARLVGVAAAEQHRVVLAVAGHVVAAGDVALRDVARAGGADGERAQDGGEPARGTLGHATASSTGAPGPGPAGEKL